MEDRTIWDGEPCSHAGCLNHTTHPCEGCGRIAGRNHDRTIMAVLYELYCDGELAGKINREGRVPELCCDKALTDIHARLKEKIGKQKLDEKPPCLETEAWNNAIDQVLKVLEGELTDGK